MMRVIKDIIVLRPSDSEIYTTSLIIGRHVVYVL